MLERDELLDVVGADLRFLIEKWGESADDHSIRRSSTILRRLLVENELQRAWKAAGFSGEPRVRAAVLPSFEDVAPLSTVIFAAAGGARFEGVLVRSVVVFNYAMPNDDARKIEDTIDRFNEFSLREFVAAQCLIVRGKEVPRRLLLKYVCNKLGGAHLDKKRGGKPDDQLYKRLDEAALEYTVAGKNAVYFELLSTGQALVGSQDIRTLLERLR